jgi:hypothetical protein
LQITRLVQASGVSARPEPFLRPLRRTVQPSLATKVERACSTPIDLIATAPQIAVSSNGDALPSFDLSCEQDVSRALGLSSIEGWLDIPSVDVRVIVNGAGKPLMATPVSGGTQPLGAFALIAIGVALTVIQTTGKRRQRRKAH